MERTRKFGKYFLTGGCAAGVYIVSWWLFAQTGIGTTNASLLAFLPTWVFKFFLHKFWVFEDPDRSTTKQQALPYGLLTFGTFCLYYIGVQALRHFYDLTELHADTIAGLGAAGVRFVIFRRFFMRKTSVS